MKGIIIAVFVFLWLISFKEVRAETWNEPWQKEIIQKSDYFVLGKILTSDEHSIKVQVLRVFGNDSIAKEIIIDDFFLLSIMSSSGHGVHFNLDPGMRCYLFLKKNERGNYSLPTPTSGYACIDDEKNVYATYRHSYHQAKIQEEVYELTYGNIWSHYKKHQCDSSKISDFIYTQLRAKPAGLGDQEVAQFFLQHVALETAYLLDISPDFTLVQKFANSENYHLRISALQLLGNNSSEESKELLMKSIDNKEYSDFEKVIAIWSIKKIGDKSYIKKLKDIQNSLSDESGGFGGNIMDPRIGTYFPSPKEAVGEM